MAADQDLDQAADITDDDLRFEEEVARAPYAVKTWQRYIDHKRAGAARGLTVVFERAVQRLPGSYKLWRQYLAHREAQLRAGSDDPRKVALCFERALLLLHKMPRVWIMYGEHAARQADVTAARRVYDRALRALPVTQHARVWPAFLQLARRVGGLTAERVYARYVRMWPDRAEESVAWCVRARRWAPAARQLVEALDAGVGDAAALWRQLARILQAQPGAVAALRVEPLLRAGIARNDAGELWAALANHLIARGLIAQARDVYEEAVARVATLRDFALVFDAYAAFEEAGVAAALEAAASSSSAEQGSLDLRLLRLERLMDRRAFLANDVVLRQSPHSVAAWLRRAALWDERRLQAADDETRDACARRVVETFEDAVARVAPAKASGGAVGDLWLAYARHYGSEETVAEFRRVMDRAVAAPLRSAGELAALYVAYAEAELARGSVDGARRVLAGATAQPAKARATVDFRDESVPAQQRVFKSLRVWALLIDIEEGVGTVDAARCAYERVLELRIATPQTVVNYARFLEDHAFFEDSFRAYERGIAAFGYPVAAELWDVYLARFVARYGAKRIERARDLFEQALDACPAQYARPIFLAYGRLEEELAGAPRRALRVYERATRGVAKEGRLEMFRFYAAKTAEFLGLPATRAVYERGVAELPDDADVAALAIDFAAAERRLGEIDRARALFAYAAPLVDPRRTQAPPLWSAWHEFEVQHGNEDTFKEMLRLKRSAHARFNTDARSLAAVEVEQKERVSSSAVAAAASAEVEAEVAPNPDALAIEIDDDDL
ncbi:pre-mRNA-splicing factor syf1 [Coemansia thaxteri]|uniref:Pre-mRNA-splicing factor SYF1 n=1 Tax=Coemansia thaxteri TaxID=2663907 RepID=A0A9W8BH87_9FUNG|nr:pre-mRNA-splicing factor syf1 [Coemansia thaxteri]KAJ2006751.1 pre-mRNA-splicing factor syf1 [Coemansia thaxteri]KAJ2465435.1 pre-mRNA-splicing factor syf1 [Coemansia sp. RSA 2322]KAJ2486574.1 pre-mRNA-splicing factor syf1 [Coemansia sp. RSA 2320]